MYDCNLLSKDFLEKVVVWWNTLQKFLPGLGPQKIFSKGKILPAATNTEKEGTVLLK